MNRKFTRTALLLGFLLSYGLLHAQRSTVAGKVTDGSSNAPLPGVNVLVKGTSLGTITDAEGGYSLNLGDTENPVLVFSFIGFARVEEPVNGRSTINFAMTPEASQLSEIVVVGYGTQKREDLTGAVSSMSSKDITALPSVNINQSMQGRVAGVFVNQTDTRPGGGITLKIRGSGSLNSGSDPIYVVDGVIMEGTLNNLNPDDIESIDVLKDASATAIYGSRGANGVVIITTKRGTNSAGQIDVHSYFGAQQIVNKIPMMNAAEYAELRREAYYNSNPTTYPYYITTPVAGLPFFKATGFTNNTDEIRSTIDPLIFQPYELQTLADGVSYDWQEEILRTAPIQNHSVQASGGTADTRYLLSLNYMDQTGIVTGSGFKRVGARLNLDQRISNKVNAGMSLNFNKNDEEVVPGSVFYSAIAASPLEPFRDDAGNYRLNLMQTGTANPMAIAEHVTNENAINQLIGNLYFDYEIIRDLTFKSSVSIDNFNSRNFYYAPSTVADGRPYRGIARVTNNQYFNWIWDNTLTYQKSFDNHVLTAMLGTTLQERRNETTSVGASNFPTDITSYKNLSAGSVREAPSSYYDKWSIASLFARANYALQDKYLFTATLRVDGSSRFGANNKYGYFPSVSAAWRISNEDFMDGLSQLSDLKFRVSYGRVGNQEIGQFRSLTLMTPYAYSFNNQPSTGYILGSTAGNPNIQWESQNQYNIGLDAGLWNNRISLTADYYVKDNEGLIFSSPLPLSGGFANTYENVAHVTTNGVELGIHATLLNGPVTWEVNASWSGVRSEVKSLVGDQQEVILPTPSGWDGNSYRVKVGEPLGLVYDYKFDGLYREGDDGYIIVPNGANLGKVAVVNSPGDTTFVTNNGRQMYVGGMKVMDVNGDNIIDNKDITNVGSTQPRGFGGFGTTVRFKGLSLNAFFNYAYGHVIYNRSYDFYMINVGQWIGNHRDGLDRWSPVNTDTQVPYAYFWHTANGAGYVNSSRFVEKGDYLRLKTLTLGYDLPSALTERLRMRNIHAYVTGTNLLTITDFKGFDPEGNQGFGWAADTYPNSKMIIAGLRLGF